VQCFAATKGMRVLQEVENQYPRLGASMVNEFFHLDLRPHEEQFWRQAKQTADEQDALEKAAEWARALREDAEAESATTAPTQTAEPQRAGTRASAPQV